MGDVVEDIKIGVCNRCNPSITGHIVVINGYAVCTYCELDVAMQGLPPKGSGFKLTINPFKLPDVSESEMLL